MLTVVAKLFHLTRADSAYFGQKDAQQLLLIRRMVRDLDFPVKVVSVPTVREADGLAMSSRNTYLTDSDREVALCLSRALRAGAHGYLLKNPALDLKLYHVHLSGVRNHSAARVAGARCGTRTGAAAVFAGPWT